MSASKAMLVLAAALVSLLGCKGDRSGSSHEVPPAVAAALQGELVPELGDMLTRAKYAKDIRALDELLEPLGPPHFAALMEGGDLQLTQRVVLLELCILRGGTRPLKASSAQAAAYQSLAKKAVFGTPDGAAVYAAMARRHDRVGVDAFDVLFLRTMAQPRGAMSPEELGAAISAMPPETRGRMFFHLHDAAHTGLGTPRLRNAGVIDYRPANEAWRDVVTVASDIVLAGVSDGNARDACFFWDGVMNAARAISHQKCEAIEAASTAVAPDAGAN